MSLLPLFPGVQSLFTCPWQIIIPVLPFGEMLGECFSEFAFAHMYMPRGLSRTLGIQCLTENLAYMNASVNMGNPNTHLPFLCYPAT